MDKPSRITSLSGGCMSLFGMPFLIAGLVLTFIYFNGYRKWLATQNWVETPCWIETAALETSHNDGTTYKATATYRYDYQGTTYRSSTVSIYGGSDNVGDFQQDAYRELAQYSESLPGERNQGKLNRGNVAPFRCYVNPHNPQQAILYRTLRWPLQAFMSIFALTFPAIGAGLVFGGVWGARSINDEDKRRLDFPEEPWKWKRIWSDREIPDQSRPWQRAIDAYSLWSAAIIAPLLIATAMTGAFTEDWYSWLLLILLGLWFVPASRSWQGFQRRRTLGNTRLLIAKPFIEPGSVLGGEILFGREVAMPESPIVQLVCEKKVTTESSDGSTTSSEVIARSENVTSHPNEFVRDFPVSRLPVSFSIPIRGKESGKLGDTEYAWKLTFEVPNTAINGTFEVPVFHSESSRALAAASLDDDDDITLSKEELRHRLLTNGIRIEWDGEQRLQSLTCERARHRAFMWFGILFNLVWTGFAVLLIISRAPWIFKLVWPLTSIGIWLMIAWYALHRRKTHFHESDLTIVNEVGPWQRSQTIARPEVVEAIFKVNMQSGSKRYHQILVKNAQGKQFAIVDGVTDEIVAKSIVDLVTQWMI